MNTPKRFHKAGRLISYQWEKYTRWLAAKINDRNYQILVSIIIGIVAGLAAVTLKWFVHTIQDFLHQRDPSYEKLIFVFFPVLGIILTLLFIRYILRKRLDIGLGTLIAKIQHKKLQIPRYETYGHLVSSSLTVGFGGSVGLEAPIIRTGSAIGSNLARILHAGRTKETLFLACGAAAGMAAIFSSPVAGVIFAFEVLLTDIALYSFIPLLISSATGAVVARVVYEEQIFFLPSPGWEIDAVPWFIVVGIFCGLFSVYLIRVTLWLQKFFNRFPKPTAKIIIGGTALGLLIFLMPPLYGEGYLTVNSLIAGDYQILTDHSLFFRWQDSSWFLVALAIVILFAKGLAAGTTMAIGGNGGIFAPSMFTGATLGFAFAHALNLIGLIELNEANFIAIGMAGMLSGVIKSPLTGIFLIAEITGGYTLFVPLMIVSALSYFVSQYFEPHSVFTKQLFQAGLWVPPHEKDKHVLKTMDVEEMVETSFSVTPPDITLKAFTNIVAQSRRNVFPVVDSNDNFLGIILLDDIRSIIFDLKADLEKPVTEYMIHPPATVDINDPMDEVMEKFDTLQAWNLPVLDGKKYVGFVSKSSIFNHYREILQRQSQEA